MGGCKTLGSHTGPKTDKPVRTFWQPIGPFLVRSIPHGLPFRGLQAQRRSPELRL
jgi:hypothetical protein